MKIYKSDLLIKSQCSLGEGPMWHPLQNKLYWVDIDKYQIWAFDPQKKERRCYETDEKPSTLAPIDNKNVLVALENKISVLNTITGKLNTIKNIEEASNHTRCNDGKCDSLGRFWIGTMDVDAKIGKGSLYCLTRNLTLKKILSQLSIPNGLDWSLDQKKMYFIDSQERTVKAYNFEVKTGNLTCGEIVVSPKNNDELPDGMCIDNNGMLWIAFWGGKRVGKYNPVTGEHLMDIEVPAINITSCTFGGRERDILFITTATTGLSKNQLQKYPLSGSIFQYKTNAIGPPANLFHYPD